MLRIVTCLFLALFAIPLVSSQFADTIKLGEVQVGASVLELRQRQSGRSVTIITAEQIRQLPVSSIDEIIRFIPGLENQSRNLYGVQTDYSIRGSTFNQVLVMIDGIRLNDPLTGHFSGYIPLTLSDIYRIEVIRGPDAVIYGPDAVGGLINFITYNPGQRNDSLLIGNIKAGTGQYALRYADAGFNSSSAKMNYGGGFKLLSSDGFPDKDNFRNDFLLRTATMSLSFNASDRIRASFRTAVDSRDFSARRFYTVSTADTARENVRIWWTQMNIIITGERSVTNFDAAYRSTGDEFLFNPLTPPNKHHTNSTIIQIRNNRELSHKIRVSTGFQGNYRTIKSNDRGNHQEFSGGIYSLGSLSFQNNMVLSAGLRMELDPNTNIEFLPQLNMSWNRGLLTFRGLAGKSIRTPDFTEKYVSTNLTGLASGRNLGNPLLVSERSWNVEAGTDLNIAPGIVIELTLFNRQGFKLIDYVLTPGSEIQSKNPLNPEAVYLYAENLNKLTINGIEAILSFDRKIGREGNLNTYLGYTLQQLSPSAKEISKYISNMSRQFFVFNATYFHNRTGVFFNGIFKQRDPEYAALINSTLSPSYWLFNTKVSYAVVRGKLFMDFRVENILNISYNDFLGAELPGRWLSGGLVYRLN